MVNDLPFLIQQRPMRMDYPFLTFIPFYFADLWTMHISPGFLHILTTEHVPPHLYLIL